MPNSDQIQRLIDAQTLYHETSDWEYPLDVAKGWQHVKAIRQLIELKPQRAAAGGVAGESVQHDIATLEKLLATTLKAVRSASSGGSYRYASFCDR